MTKGNFYGKISRSTKFDIPLADMAELADAYGSGPYESNFMQVQVLLSAPKIRSTHLWVLRVFYSKIFVKNMNNLLTVLSKYVKI